MVVSARWATVDRSWPEQWNWCARADLHFLKKKWRGRIVEPSPQVLASEGKALSARTRLLELLCVFNCSSYFSSCKTACDCTCVWASRERERESKWSSNGLIFSLLICVFWWHVILKWWRVWEGVCVCVRVRVCACVCVCVSLWCYCCLYRFCTRLGL